MKKIAVLLILFLAVMPGFRPVSAQLDDPHLRAMGSIRYVLAGDWNRFNLFDLGKNPAWLHEENTQDWLRIWNNNGYTRGDFRRLYDAEKINSSAVSFAGAKRLNDKHTFLGRVTYYNEQLIGVPFALEKNPYSADPFILADSSSGGYRFWGPDIDVIYSRKLSHRFNVGAELQYTLDSAVRNREAMVRIVQRNLISKAGFTFRLNKRIITGVTYLYKNLFDRTEVPKQQDGRVPVTYRYRGYIISRRELRTYMRNAKSIHHTIENQWLLRPVNSLNLLLKAGYHFHYLDLYDGSSVRYYEAYWQQNEVTFDFIGKFSRSGSPWVYVGFANGFFSSDWSRHYRLPVLITEQSKDDLEYGLGISFRPDHHVYRMGAEIAMRSGNYRFSDYIGHTDFDVRILAPEIRLGGEYFFNRLLSAQAGVRLRDYRLTGEMPYLLSSNLQNSLSFGLTLYQKKYLLEFVSIYRWDNPTESGLGQRNYFELMLNSKFDLQ